MKKLAILDFDRTIYKGDSMRDFARYLNPAVYLFSIAVVALPAALTFVGVGSRDSLKKVFLRINFGKQSREVLQKKGLQFFELNKKRYFAKALNWIIENKSDTRMIIVSGSCPEWLQPFADDLGAELLCTELSYDENGICTGEWVDENITGEGKVRIVKQVVDLEAYSKILAFGDQKSDAHLTEIADEFHLNYFRD